MALNATEIEILKGLAWRLDHPRVLSLGYPDLQMDRKNLAEIFAVTDPTEAAFRPDSADVARVHGQPRLERGVFTAEYVFGLMGARFAVADIFPPCDHALDMNRPVPADLRGRFDIVIDPGTLEHVFDVAQGFRNVAELVRVGGFVYLQHPMMFPNHGHWAMSPTAHFDFFTNNGFTVELLALQGAAESDNFRPSIKPLDPRATVFPEEHPAILAVVARKVADLEIVMPLQWNYSEMLLTEWRAAVNAYDLGASHAAVEEWTARWMAVEPHRATADIAARFALVADGAHRRYLGSVLDAALRDMPKRRHALGLSSPALAR